MRISSITVAKRILSFAVWGVCIAPSLLYAQECRQSRGLTSNDILWLVGNVDTLWMVTRKDDGPALNMIAGEAAMADPTGEDNWWSYSLSCRREGINDLAVGGGRAVASLDSSKNVIWVYEHSTSRVREYALPWPKDTGRTFIVDDIAYSGGKFFFAALDGGLVRWNPDTDEKTVFVPGRRGGVRLSTLVADSLPQPDTMLRVIGVEAPVDGASLFAVTPARLWRFSESDSSWDSSIVSVMDDAGLAFLRYEYIFVNRFDPSLPIYGILSFEGGGEERQAFFKYNRLTRSWHLMFDTAPKALSFAPQGYFYALFDDDNANVGNIISQYRDTLGDSGVIGQPVATASSDRFHRRMTRAHDIDVPDLINDVIYLPRTDSTGYLWIASSEGLFFSADERPYRSGNDTVSFVLVKRAPSVDAGLEKTYARPGIMTPFNGSCKFIYNIGADKANVTIRVYDYNMDLVTTIIEKRPRLSGRNGGPLGRSTVESEDFWDGTKNNRGGRPVSPGVYYYKITTDSGERAFGKIVVAR